MRCVSRLPAACGSDGPRWPFGTQRSPDLRYSCLSAAYAVRWARSPSPYVFTAASWVLTKMSWARWSDLRIVLGRSSLIGMVMRHADARPAESAAGAGRRVQPGQEHQLLHFARVKSE